MNPNPRSSQHTRPLRPWPLALTAVLAFGGCESTTEVGSDCRHGVCPQANAIESRACLMSSTQVEIQVIAAGGFPEFAEVCLPPPPLPRDDEGQVECRVRWRLGETDDPGEQVDPLGNPLEVVPGPESCDDRAFLEHAEGEPENVCEMRQLTDDEVAAGTLDGWHYIAGGGESCAVGSPAIRFTDGVMASEVVVEVSCHHVEAEGADGALVPADAASCVPLPESGAADLGAACLPAGIPRAGFDDRTAAVEVGAQQCQTGACLVYRLRGHPEQDACESDAGEVPDVCAAPSEVEDRIYCSCRCDAPESEGDDLPLCECGEGFSCIEVLADGLEGYAGSYCVRDGTFTR